MYRTNTRCLSSCVCSAAPAPAGDVFAHVGLHTSLFNASQENFRILTTIVTPGLCDDVLNNLARSCVISVGTFITLTLPKRLLLNIVVVRINNNYIDML